MQGVFGPESLALTVSTLALTASVARIWGRGSRFSGTAVLGQAFRVLPCHRRMCCPPHDFAVVIEQRSGVVVRSGRGRRNRSCQSVSDRGVHGRHEECPEDPLFMRIFKGVSAGRSVFSVISEEVRPDVATACRNGVLVHRSSMLQCVNGIERALFFFYSGHSSNRTRAGNSTPL